jgi:very-short-patch-repair endonuclease
VIEVDGSQHYSEDDRPSPRLYAEMVSEDRKLRLAGYEVYRFGATELKIPNVKSMLTKFFTDLMLKHGIETTK